MVISRCARSYGLLLALVAGCRGAGSPPERPAERAATGAGSANPDHRAPAGVAGAGAPVQAGPEPDERPRALRRFLEGAPPAYPEISRRLGEEGTVEVSIVLDPDGTLREVALVSSSGFARLDAAALAAVRRWLFSPVTGTHEREVLRHRIRFRLVDR